MTSTSPVVLLILDGWGVDHAHPHNAIEAASTPQWDKWWRTMPHGLLEASGEAVGLPPGQIGNSEVGHMHIGAGRLIRQDLTRINQSILEGSWYDNDVLTRLLQLEPTQTLHVMGLLSPGGVHSHEDHLFDFLALCEKKRVSNVALHLFLDGRDTPPQSAMASLDRLEKVLKQHPVGHIASLCGRYYAMDRDNRWDRVNQAYQLITEAKANHHFNDAKTALQSHYDQHLTDEFIPPTLIGTPHPMHDGDCLFFFNYRSDRARQLTQALVDPHFVGFERGQIIHFNQAVTMTAYQTDLPVEVVFPPVRMQNTLGEVLAAHHLRQLRIAETEKYAHVTFFLNGGNEAIYPGEDRYLVPSPNIATYDLQPEMSAKGITDKLVDVIEAGTYDVILCNYANADMIGHTGNMAATKTAIEYLDKCMARVGKAVEKVGGILLITADHGNAEVMYDETTQQPHTAHTNHLVPFLCVAKGWCYEDRIGTLSDVAPTLLSILGLKQPKDMTGKTLLHKELDA